MLFYLRLIFGLGSAITLILLGTTNSWHTFLGVEPSAGIALSILMLAALSWVSEVIPLFVTSLLVLVLNIIWLLPELEAQNIQVTASTFSAPFFSDVILLFLGGFVLSASFARFGLDVRLAQIVLRNTGSRPSMALAGLMLTTAFLSMWMSNTATTAMMLGLAGPMLAQKGTSQSLKKAVMLGIPFSANLGGLGTPIGTPPNAIALQYIRELGTEGPSFPTWMIMVIPSLIFLIVLTWALLLSFYSRPTDKLVFESSFTQPFSKGELGVIILTLVTILGWLTGPFHGIPTGIVALFPVIMGYSTGLLDSTSFRQLPWDVLILAGGGMSLGVAVQTSGLATTIVSMVPDNAPLLVIAIAFSVIASTLSTFMSNTATANLLIPVALGLPSSIQQPIICVIAFACSVSMALPITTPPNAMAFGAGHLRVADMVVPGAIVSMVGVVLSIINLFWWQTLGIF